MTATSMPPTRTPAGAPVVPVERPASEPEVWLSVHEASAMLGVSSATLRRWSSAGDVEAFTTPGGHRRFALSTLQALLPHRSDPGATPSGLGESPERLCRAIRRRTRTACAGQSWTTDVDAPEREMLRGLGRTIVESLVAHLDAPERGDDGETLAPARAACTAYGRVGAAHGMTVTELVAVFGRFRGLVAAELLESVRRGRLASPDGALLVVRAGEAMETLLLALLEGHPADIQTREVPSCV